MPMLLLFLVFAAGPRLNQCPPIPTEPPSLVVQVVDPAWLPVAGAEVSVDPLDAKSQSDSKRADKDGYARFFKLAAADYSIEVKLPGFKPGRLNPMRLLKRTDGSPTAYVQMQLRLSESLTMVE
jgi:carboxypeptidase family protein